MLKYRIHNQEANKPCDSYDIWNTQRASCKYNFGRVLSADQSPQALPLPQNNIRVIHSDDVGSPQFWVL